MELREGYKNTEVGVIPDDWEVKTFGDLMEKIIGGGTPSRTNQSFWGNEIPWVTVKDFATFNSSKTQEYITKDGLKNSASHLIPKGTIITSTRMALGQAVIYDVDVSINQDLKAIFPKSNLDTIFFKYWFQFNSKFIEDLGSGSTVMGLSLPDLKKIKVIVPPTKAEQTAIATALSDADALINSISTLIAKKRNIKQGAMQKLLNPMVNDELLMVNKNQPSSQLTTNHLQLKKGWEVKRLGELAEIYTGKKNNQDKVENGSYPFFVRSQTVESINSYSFDGEAILIPGEGNIGKIFHYINGKFDYHQRVYKISDFKQGYFGKYIYRYISEYFGRHAMENSVKATVDSLRLPTFQIFEIPFPPTMNEQVEISNILSDMDAEIQALETKLEKYRKLKQGMMQNLLTGKIRLV